MQGRKKIPNKPRFEYVAKKAYDLLFELGYDRFPISAEQVLSDLPGKIECLSWFDAKSILDTDDPFHLRQTNADARTTKLRGDDTYLIVYKASFSAERNKWTLLHEIAHIILGHLDEFDATALDRGGLTPEAYSFLEVEANWFVSEFLMPTPIVKMIDNLSAKKISLLFGVSVEAAKKKIDHIRKHGHMFSKYDEDVRRQFYRFMEKEMLDTLYRRNHNLWGSFRSSRSGTICCRCENCRSYSVNTKASYCYHCGSIARDEPIVYPFFIEDTASETTQGFTHPLIPHNETSNFRMDFCPLCLNQELDADAEYCHICGSSVHNECTKEHIELPLNMSYCPSCGASTTIGEMYREVEERLTNIEKWSDPQLEDYIAYDHWLYMKMKISQSPAFTGTPVIPALFYTNAYLDDDNNLVLITDTQSAADAIMKSEKNLLRFISNYDIISPEKIFVEVVETTKAVNLEVQQ